jgi:hypothetical protein
MNTRNLGRYMRAVGANLHKWEGPREIVAVRNKLRNVGVFFFGKRIPVGVEKW